MSLTDSIRQETLDEAKALVTGDRNNAYGPPTQDFKRTADAMNAMGYRKLRPIDSETDEVLNLEAFDVAIILALVKVSRLTWSPQKVDSWVDLAGYAACGAECAMTEEEG